MKKKTIIIIAACVLICTATASIYFGVTGSTKEPLIVYGHPKYVINVADTREVSGFVDFVFVGKVEKQNGLKYEAVSTRETDKGLKSTGLPYTAYDITVLENIKGNLKTGETISFWKSGGLTMDGKYISLEEGDFLPETKDICMFYANAWNDGTLRILGTGGNIKLMESTLANNEIQVQSAEQKQQAAQAEVKSIEASPIYQELVEACENEIPYEGIRFTAPAELLEAPQ